jgi:DNA-binding MarR family transcriptional regulator
MESWNFLTSHARVLLCIARDPGVRLRDIAASLGITERSAYGIVTDLTAAGYVTSRKTAAATATRSRHTSRCPKPPASNPPSAKSSPSSRAPARDCR